MKDNIPPHAVTITFDFDGVKGRMHVWPTKVETEQIGPVHYSTIANPTRYQWSALGNCGEEDTHEKAVESARNWVRGLVTKTDKEID